MARSPVPSKKMDSTTSQMIRTHTMSKNGARHTYPGGSGPSATRTESAQNPAHHQTSATSCRKSHRSILFAAELRARAAEPPYPAPHGSPSPCAEADEIGTRRSMLRSGERYIGGNAFYGTAVGRNIAPAPTEEPNKPPRPPASKAPEKASGFSYPCSSRASYPRALSRVRQSIRLFCATS
jgi:hypothetical protein